MHVSQGRSHSPTPTPVELPLKQSDRKAGQTDHIQELDSVTVPTGMYKRITHSLTYKHVPWSLLVDACPVKVHCDSMTTVDSCFFVASKSIATTMSCRRL